MKIVNMNEIIGWGGILPQYNRNVFELHPLTVKENMRRNGVGAAIVKALEDAARNRGGITMQLGADDDVNDGETYFANVDLYDNLPRRIENFNQT